MASGNRNGGREAVRMTGSGFDAARIAVRLTSALLVSSKIMASARLPERTEI